MDFKEEDVINVDLGGKMKGLTKKIRNIGGVGLVLIILAGIFITSIYRLPTGTVAVITRFGEIMTVNEQAGIHFKVPLIDRVRKVDVETVHKLEYGYRTTKAGSVNQNPQYADEVNEEQVIIEARSNNASIVLLNLIVRYQISDPINYLYEVDDVEGTMRLALEDSVRTTMQTMSMDEALENKEIIDATVLPLLQSKLNKYNTGVRVVQVTTQNVSLLPSVEITRQQVEEANQYKKGREEEAQKYINSVIPRAEAEATRLYEAAKGFRAEVVASAKADVAEFEALYSEYQINPEVVKEKYYVEAMQEVIENNQLILDQSSGGNFLKFFNASEGLLDSNKNQ
jgi:membrane protease subunit HflK